VSRASASLDQNCANRLSSAQVGGTTNSYSYDGDGTRTSKTANGMTTPYVWDRPASGGSLLAGDGTNGYLGDPSGASDATGGSGSLLGQLDGGSSPTYYLDDGLGSVRGTVGTAGTLAGSADYDVFGAGRAVSGQQPGSGIGYSGEQTDAETGLQYLRARDYNPLLGRFLSAGSMQPNAPGTQGYTPGTQGYNLYAYVANNPTSWADPSGHGISIDWINRIGVGPALVGACGSTPWCVRPVDDATETYVEDLALEGDSGVGVALATLAYGADLVYIAVADFIDTTNGSGPRQQLLLLPWRAIQRGRRRQRRWRRRRWRRSTTGSGAADAWWWDRRGRTGLTPGPCWTKPPGAQQIHGPFPDTAGPGDTLYRRSPETGGITNYQPYDEDGLPIKRVDVTGAAHAGIPTPHVQEFGRGRIDPKTGRPYVTRGKVRPARPDAIPCPGG
jgi:RHS repeat-associated protein